MSERKQISVDHQESAPQRVELTRGQRLRRTAGAVVALTAATGWGVSAHDRAPENTYGQMVQDVINVGVAGVDMIPGVDTAETSGDQTPHRNESDKLQKEQGSAPLEELPPQ